MPATSGGSPGSQGCTSRDVETIAASSRGGLAPTVQSGGTTLESCFCDFLITGGWRTWVSCWPFSSPRVRRSPAGDEGHGRSPAATSRAGPAGTAGRQRVGRSVASKRRMPSLIEVSRLRHANPLWGALGSARALDSDAHGGASTRPTRRARRDLPLHRNASANPHTGGPARTGPRLPYLTCPYVLLMGGIINLSAATCDATLDALGFVVDDDYTAQHGVTADSTIDVLLRRARSCAAVRRAAGLRGDRRRQLDRRRARASPASRATRTSRRRASASTIRTRTTRSAATRAHALRRGGGDLGFDFGNGPLTFCDHLPQLASCRRT